jgi:phosphatidylserine/phosphatidylglycerophosphate/cardiolipin synthase-like enzyme
MPMWVQRSESMRAVPQEVGTRMVAPIFEIELVGRNCHLSGYDKKPVPKIKVSSEIIAYSSPDSTFAVTKKFFDAATKSILIGIYDFSASYMRQLLLDAMARGVKVSLMLDIDGKTESKLFDDLVQMGVTGVSAPSCANKHIHVFASSHEKVIVIDDEWCLVQSGNYSENSIPLNVVDGADKQHYKTGNRDTGLAVRSTKLAAFFTEILTSDMALVTATPQMLEALPDETAFLIEKAPDSKPKQLYPSKRFKLTAPLMLQPVLSPDNYMDVVPGLLKKAKKSILIEQQYIRAKQADITILLEAIGAARKANPTLDVRIVLGKVFDAGDLPKEHQNLDLLAETYKLQLGSNIRYINTDQLVHCHNKMIVVDGSAVLISSQNWSDSAVSKNREAGLWVPHAGIAKYFAAIFETDWKAGFKTPEKGVTSATATPESLRQGGFIRVERADYEEV